MKILVIDPGSASTKFGIYKDGEWLLKQRIYHEFNYAERSFAINEQEEMRFAAVDNAMKKNELAGKKLDAVAGRGGLMKPVRGGTYMVNEHMVHDLREGTFGMHASNLGAILAVRFAERHAVKAYTVDPVVVDELEPVAKLSGLKGIERESIFHALNQKAVADEKKLWNRMRRTYEFLSRIRTVPVIGKPLFGVLDALQTIPPFYPMRDMSRAPFQVRLLSSMIDKGLCRGMLAKIQEQPLPLVTSYPAPAIAADKSHHGRIYCIICDAEISRAWVAEDPQASKIHYLVPCGRSVMRLKSYGVPDERIFLTGFPFPLAILGNKNLDILRADAGQRLFYLDPLNRFWPLHGRNVEYFLGKENCRFNNSRAFTVTFAVGGAGAQKEIGLQIARSLREEIASGKVLLNLIAGIREDVHTFFTEVKQELLPNCNNLRIVYSPDKTDYFNLFSDVIRVTDVLWTKPSELSFYCGLGIPIIIAPPIGAQELFNNKWLLEVQAGIPQEDPEYTKEWLFDFLRMGRLAESAWDGFLKARKYGTYKIFEILATGTMTREKSPLKR